MSRFLSAEPLFVARLTERLADLDPRPHVLTAPDLAGVTEEQQLSPAVHIVYLGSALSQETGDGLITQIEQTWLTVIAVRHVASIRSGDAARADASVLLDAVWAALAGWRPSDDLRRLRPATPPRSGYTAGFGYYPLAWTTRLQMRGDGA